MVYPQFSTLIPYLWLEHPPFKKMHHVKLSEKKGHGSNPDYFFVRVGSTDRMAGTKYEVEKVIPNDRFNENQYKEYDIALMRLKTAIVMGPNVGTICLPEQSYSEPEGGVIVTGWGDTVYGNPSSQRALQQVDLDIFVPTKCAQMYIGKFNYKIFKSQFCTMNMNKDACQVNELLLFQTVNYIYFPISCLSIYNEI